MRVTSTVKLNMPRMKQLSQAAVTALERTAEALHTEVVQAQVMPFDTGHLEEDATFVDYSNSRTGRYHWFQRHPMHAGCITIRNITSKRMKTHMQAGNGMSHGCLVESVRIL